MVNKTTESGKIKSMIQNDWWKTSCDLPAFKKTYTPVMQKRAERKMNSVIDKLLSNIKKQPGYIQKEPLAWGSQMKSQLRIIGDELLELDGGGVEALLEGGYCKVTSDFIDRARVFDPSVKTIDIMQAMRNAWVMNCIQELSGKNVEFTPALFAYSMLYPYTDNYLDSPKISLEMKKKYSDRFRKRLSGENIQTRDPYEVKLYRLVEIIESQYDRKEFPNVYGSLLEIHDAQQKSLKQHKSIVSPYESDILGISIEKGSASVLADAWLVNGSLCYEEIYFMSSFGVFLQLADDAQDLGTDIKNKHMTIFSQTAETSKLDSIMNKLFNFIFNMIDNDKYYIQPNMQQHKLLIRSGCIFLLFSAVANNSKKYSKAYIKSLECHSPFSFSYIQKLYKKASIEFAGIFGNRENGPIDSIIARALAQSV